VFRFALGDFHFARVASIDGGGACHVVAVAARVVRGAMSFATGNSHGVRVAGCSASVTECFMRVAGCSANVAYRLVAYALDVVAGAP
jgi:hypothetical protein